MKKLIIFLLAVMMLACAKDDGLEIENGIQAETSETFTNKAKKEKVRICHYGKTRDVPSKTVSMHLGHGDYLGSCIPCPSGIADLDQFCEDLENILSQNPPSDNYRCKRNYEYSWVDYSIVEPGSQYSVSGLKTETDQINMYYATNSGEPYVLVYYPGEDGYSEAEALFNYLRDKVISENGYDCEGIGVGGVNLDCDTEPWTYPEGYEFFGLCDFLENVDLHKFICYSRTTTFGSLSDMILEGQYESYDVKIQLSNRVEELPDRPDAAFVLDVKGFEYLYFDYLEGPEYTYILDMMNYIRHLAWTNSWKNFYNNCNSPAVISCCEGIE